MELIAIPKSGHTVIRVNASRIDAPSALQFKEEMRALTDSAEARFVLDMAEVTFIDSSGLGAVVASMKQLSAGKTLELAALQPLVSKVFRLTRMDSVFVIHDSADLASVPREI